MNAAAAESRDILRPRPPQGMGAGALLALLVHGGLVAALAFAVSWRSSEPAGVEAELWAAVPQVAAPEPTRAPPPPEPKPEPKPEPPPPPPPPKAEPTPAPPDPQIAIEQERQRRAEAERREREEAERRERERVERERVERERVERERAERPAREKAERERAERQAREKAERERREAERLAEAREENLRRMQALAGGTPSTGTATRTAGPSATYAGRIKARIKPNIVFADAVSGNPLASVEVRAAADGTIVGRRLLRSSGIPAWDEAVLRAIDKTEVLPRDTDGRVPSTIVIDFRPQE